jgi:hypothetical protein
MELSEPVHPRPSLVIPFFLALCYVALQALTASRYGYFRDALYYLACGEHLAWGYVDQPPLIALFAWIARHTLGVSLPALLFWPALAGATRIVLTGAFARELGAGRFGVALAAALAATAGVWYVEDHQFAMNAFEPLFWTGCAFVLLRMVNTRNPRLWLAFGAVAGLGLQNKYSMAFFAGALLLGLLCTSQRKLLFTPWLFAGGAVAFLIFLPNFIWNVQHHWPFLELMHNIRASGRDVVLSPLAFFGQQILLLTPASFPFWFAGLLFYLFSKRAQPYRFLGWTFLIAIGFFLLAHGKNYYSAPAYPIVLAAGGWCAEVFIDSARFAARPRLRIALQAGCFAWLMLGVLLLLPLVLPVLPLDAYLRYQERMPFGVPRSEHGHAAILPQHYADELGWEDMVKQVARIYQSLPEDQQRDTAIYAENYGEAGAIDFFGPKYGLPKAICAHQNYFLWGPRGYSGKTMILIGSERLEDATPYFESVEVAAQLDNPYGEPSEKRPILLARGLKTPLRAFWPGLKHWD